MWFESQHALAGAHEANGQAKEAVLLLDQVVTVKKQTLSSAFVRLVSVFGCILCLAPGMDSLASLAVRLLRSAARDTLRHFLKTVPVWADHYQGAETMHGVVL